MKNTCIPLLLFLSFYIQAKGQDIDLDLAIENDSIVYRITNQSSSKLIVNKKLADDYDYEIVNLNPAGNLQWNYYDAVNRRFILLPGESYSRNILPAPTEKGNGIIQINAKMSGVYANKRGKATIIRKEKSLYFRKDIKSTLNYDKQSNSLTITVANKMNKKIAVINQLPTDAFLHSSIKVDYLAGEAGIYTQTFHLFEEEVRERTMLPNETITRTIPLSEKYISHPVRVRLFVDYEYHHKNGKKAHLYYRKEYPIQPCSNYEQYVYADLRIEQDYITFKITNGSPIDITLPGSTSKTPCGVSYWEHEYRDKNKNWKYECIPVTQQKAVTLKPGEEHVYRLKRPARESGYKTISGTAIMTIKDKKGEKIPFRISTYRTVYE